MYAIKVLEKTIKDHYKEIDKLNKMEPEMQCEMISIDTEISNHNHCINKLKDAIAVLTKNK